MPDIAGFSPWTISDRLSKGPLLEQLRSPRLRRAQRRRCISCAMNVSLGIKISYRILENHGEVLLHLMCLKCSIL